MLEGLIPHSCRSSTLTALIDSRAVGNFIDLETARNLNIPLHNHPPSIHAIDGKITHRIVPVTLITSALHQETITFLITTSRQQAIILGNSWLRLHDLLISWNSGTILHWSEHCHAHCLMQPQHSSLNHQWKQYIN